MPDYYSGIAFLKALHIVGFVSWFAALFYLGRLFVYHVEAGDKPQPEQDILRRQYELMQKRLYQIICNPAMMITWTAGLLMIGLNIYQNTYEGSYLKTGSPGWLHLKLLLLVILTGYHLWSKRIMKKQADGKATYSDFQFRLLNEVPTILLVAITFIAVYGSGRIAPLLNYVYLGIGLIIFAVLLYVGARAYKDRRERQS